MSFEVYLQSFSEHEPSGMSRSSIREVFAPFIVDDADPNYLKIEYDAMNSCWLHLTPLNGSSDCIHSMSIQRPCGDSRLWESVLRLMNLGNLVFYFPGDSPPLVTDESVAGHLPPDMIDTLGQPVCVESHDQILEYIRTG